MLQKTALLVALALPTATANPFAGGLGCPYLLAGGNPLAFEAGLKKHPWLREMMGNMEGPHRRTLADSTPVGICEYASPFPPFATTCDEYHGEYTVESATSGCSSSAVGATFTPAVECPQKSDPAFMAVCVNGAGSPYEKRTVMTGSAADCGMSKMGCETFGGGMFYGTETCPDSKPVAELMASGAVVEEVPFEPCVRMDGLGGSAHMMRSSGWNNECEFEGLEGQRQYRWPLQWHADFEEHHPDNDYVLGGHIWYDTTANIKRTDQFLKSGTPPDMGFYGGAWNVTSISKEGQWYMINHEQGTCQFMTLPVGGLRPDWHLDDCCGGAQRSQFMGREYFYDQHHGRYVRAVKFRKSELDPHFVAITVTEPEDTSKPSLPLYLEIPAGAAVSDDFVRKFYNHEVVPDFVPIVKGATLGTQVDITGDYECVPFTYSEDDMAAFMDGGKTWMEYTTEEMQMEVQVPRSMMAGPGAEQPLGASSGSVEVSSDPLVVVEWAVAGPGSVQFTVTAAESSGYVALSFVENNGRGMSPADAAAVCLSAPGELTVTPYRLESFSSILPDPSQTFSDAAVEFDSSGHAVMRFTRALDNGGKVKLAEGKLSMNWALGAGCSADSLTYHSARGNFQIQLAMEGSPAPAPEVHEEEHHEEHHEEKHHEEEAVHEESTDLKSARQELKKELLGDSPTGTADHRLDNDVTDILRMTQVMLALVAILLPLAFGNILVSAFHVWKALFAHSSPADLQVNVSTNPVAAKGGRPL